jgi:hypothetical protein
MVIEASGTQRLFPDAFFSRAWTVGRVPVIERGETWWVALRYERRRVAVLERYALPRWWKCRDLLTDAEFIAREDWFVEIAVPRSCRKRRSTNEADSQSDDA